MRKIAICLMFLLSISFAYASSNYEVNYKIYGDKTLVEINFGEVSEFEFNIPYDAINVEVNIEGYELTETGDGNLLKVEYSPNLQISYVADYLIEKTSDGYLFIIVNNFDVPLSIVLSLPEGGILAEGRNEIVVPDADSITTDGRVISLVWNNFTQEEIVVAYEKPSDLNWSYFFILILLILAIISYLAYPYIKSRFGKTSKTKTNVKVSRKVRVAKVKKEVTRNLFGEEKQIIEYLVEKKGKGCWTKEIVRDLGISKVKLSRRLRDLVQRGLIEKIPYGNENRIRLLKSA